MLSFTITTDSEDFSSASSIRLSSSSNDVQEIEVARIWMAIKDGKFEAQARQMLERFCAKRGMDLAKVLPDSKPSSHDFVLGYHEAVGGANVVASAASPQA